MSLSNGSEGTDHPTLSFDRFLKLFQLIISPILTYFIYSLYHIDIVYIIVCDIDYVIEETIL